MAHIPNPSLEADGLEADEFTHYEYERRFFCEGFDPTVRAYAPTLIIQSYFLASEGYAIRVRLQASGLKLTMSEKTDFREVLDNYADFFNTAFITVKGPSIGGTRYEFEEQIDPFTAMELVKRGGGVIIKNRYPEWIAKDGWVIDVFGANNFGLTIAECERLSPVTDLEIPSFCVKEITDEKRFSNDSLSQKPFSSWAKDYRVELADFLKNHPNEAFSSWFGENTRTSELPVQAKPSDIHS